MTTLLASLTLTLALAVYIFFPEKKVAAQSEKTRVEYLEERKTVLYDNLRDLSFEHRAGKYRDEEYATERAALEAEAATVIAELEALLDGRNGQGMAGVALAAKPLQDSPQRPGAQA